MRRDGEDGIKLLADALKGPCKQGRRNARSIRAVPKPCHLGLICLKVAED